MLMTVNSCLEPTSFKDATFEQLKTVVRFVRDSSTFFCALQVKLKIKIKENDSSKPIIIEVHIIKLKCSILI